MEKTLYQKDSSNNVRVWTIEVIDYGSKAVTTISSGVWNGAMVHNTTQIVEGKNFGKSNETTYLEQAELEAQSKINAQIKKGYVDNLKNLKDASILGSGIPAPMLAHKHHPTGEQASSKTLKQIGILNKKIIIQPKLDGNRCLIKIDSSGAKMYTRSGDLMPVQLDHVLKSICNSYLNHHLTEELILDGELFSPQISFNKLNGLIKRVTIDEQGKKDRLQILYHIYDVMTEDGYEIRKNIIDMFGSETVIVVPSVFIDATDETIKTNLENFLAAGHEGLMIRQLGMPYDHKRSWQLCKVKVFEDKEFQLIGFEEDVRGGFVGSFVMEDTVTGKIFNAGASGQSIEERTYMWNNQDEFIGKMATVAYFGVSEYGVPRFGKFKSIRN